MVTVTEVLLGLAAPTVGVVPHRKSPIADRLAAHLRAGTRLDLARTGPGCQVLDETEMRAWDESHDVDADVLRDLLRGRVVTDPDPRGIRLRGARIRGRLDLDRVSTTITLQLEDCVLHHGLTAKEAHLPAVALHRCRLAHPTEPALRGDELRVDSSVSLVGAVLSADTTGGTIRLLDARIGGVLDCRGATLRNSTGPALHADRLQTAGDVFLDAGFTAEGAGVDSTIRLLGARIGGVLGCGGATLRNSTGCALHADRLQTCGNVFLDEGFTAEGAGVDGTIRLLGARIGDQLGCRGATLRNSTGPALVADGLQTGGDVFLDKGFTAEGDGELATIRLPGARIGGLLVCCCSTVTSRSGPQHRWLIDGLSYNGVPLLDLGGRDREAWLELLRDATPYYAAQPYQQLAATYRAEGHDSDVRAILIAQRRDQLDRGALTRADRWWARLTGVLLGYGYQPWRALLYLLGVLTVSVVLALVLGGHGALARTPESNPKPSPAGAQAPALVPCTLVQTIGKGLDLGTPFLPTSRSASGSCETTTSTTGGALTISQWLLQLAAWALAALFIAGFTGIVRRA